MSDVITKEPKPKTTREGSVDKNAFAQVEKWMALIRELSLEQTKSSSI